VLLVLLVDQILLILINLSAGSICQRIGFRYSCITSLMSYIGGTIWFLMDIILFFQYFRVLILDRIIKILLLVQVLLLLILIVSAILHFIRFITRLIKNVVFFSKMIVGR